MRILVQERTGQGLDLGFLLLFERQGGLVLGLQRVFHRIGFDLDLVAQCGDPRLQANHPVFVGQEDLALFLVFLLARRQFLLQALDGQVSQDFG